VSGPASRAETICLTGAAQVLRPPEEGLPYLRHDRADQLRLDPVPVWVSGGEITAFEEREAALRLDASGCAVVPGFIDCHTHLPFAGWRAEEYERRIGGASYEEIAREGGGIAASAQALAEAADNEVLGQASALAGEMLAWGTTAFETKSGYGLSPEGELRALRLAAELEPLVAQATVATALLAHAVPRGYTADAWMDEVESLLPRIVAETQAAAVDIYVEWVAFSNDHLARLGELAARAGLALRCHVEQFNTNRSVPVALEHGARSVDHLACLHPDDVDPLAAAECVAVLLPGAELMAQERAAPGRRLADAGAICAIATDANPGTSPLVSIPLVIGLGVRRYGWTAREAVLATTHNAAWVIGLHERTGSLEVGKRADLLLLEFPIEHIPYRLGHNPVLAALRGGKLVHVREDARPRVHSR
jgi:imidazolonepropionase